MNRAYRIRLVKPELIELIKFRRRSADRVNLIYAQYNRLAAFSEHSGDFSVVSSDAGAYVGKKNNNIGVTNGYICLILYVFHQNVVGVGLYSAGINHHHGSAAPLNLKIQTVSCYTRRVLNNSYSFADYFIKKSAFSYVWSSDNRHNRFWHIISFLPFTKSAKFLNSRKVNSLNHVSLFIKYFEKVIRPNQLICQQILFRRWIDSRFLYLISEQARLYSCYRGINLPHGGA